MAVLHKLPETEEHLLQTCPFCGQKQPVFVRGGRTTIEDGKFNTEVFPDLGYSFCNCKNVFYTNWENIRQSIYNKFYENKHNGKIIEDYAKKYWALHEKSVVSNAVGKEFLEVGAINPYILNCAKQSGFNTTGLDIFEHDEFGHALIIADFEKWDGRSWFDDFSVEKRFDVVWASHIFEHFEKPLEALKKCGRILNPGGLLFVAMPDPFFIDWRGVYSWCHWHLREHHIFWDMDSFIDECKEVGFELIYSKRSTIKQVQIWGDFQLLMRKL